MSFRGQIEAKCPKGCEPFITDVWTFIHGDKSPELRDSLLWRECNLLLCDGCSAAFFPDTPYIYFEKSSDLLAFVFPESYREKETFWRAKMHADFLIMKEQLHGEISLVSEPELFFGQEDLAELLEREDFRGEEREVMEFLAAELGLSLFRVDPGFSRREGVPRTLPYAPKKKGEPATEQTVVAGLEKIVAANDRLGEYAVYLKKLKTDASAFLPPKAKEAAKEA